MRASGAAGRTRRALLAAALLCAAVAVRTSHAARTPDEVAFTNGEVEVTDMKLISALAEARAAAGKPRLFHDKLVESRPLVGANGSNWYSYDYSVFANYNRPTDTFLGVQSVERGNLPSGVLNMTLEWKPLPQLTSKMVQWMFGNLHKPALSPFDNKTYPMYWLLHPTDHITFLAQPADKPVGRGSTFTFIENPGSGCRYQRASFTEPWVCPANRTGFTRATPEPEWAAYPQTNATLVLETLGLNECTWYKERLLPHFGKRVVVTSKMTWEDTPRGLVLRASRLAGVMAPNKTAAFERANATLLRQANEVVRVAYLDGNFDDNITASAYAFALHWGQEWTGMTAWLPQVYHEAMRLKDAGADDFMTDDGTAAAAAAAAVRQPAGEHTKQQVAQQQPGAPAAATNSSGSRRLGGWSVLALALCAVLAA